MYDLAGSGPGSVTGNPAEPYFDNCNWWVQDLKISRNSFSMNANPSTKWAAGRVTNCRAASGCGYMTLYANVGPCTTGCFWSPYAGLSGARRIVSRAAHNVWTENSYTWTGPGAWSFEAGSTGNVLPRSAWQGPRYRQDAGSEFGRPAHKPAVPRPQRGPASPRG
jgi:hypothetical protein